VGFTLESGARERLIIYAFDLAFVKHFRSQFPFKIRTSLISIQIQIQIEISLSVELSRVSCLVSPCCVFA